MLQSSHRSTVYPGSRRGKPNGSFETRDGVAFILLNLEESDVFMSDQKKEGNYIYI